MNVYGTLDQTVIKHCKVFLVLFGLSRFKCGENRGADSLSIDYLLSIESNPIYAAVTDVNKARPHQLPSSIVLVQYRVLDRLQEKDPNECKDLYLS